MKVLFKKSTTIRNNQRTETLSSRVVNLSTAFLNWKLGSLQLISILETFVHWWSVAKIQDQTWLSSFPTSSTRNRPAAAQFRR